MGLVLKFFFFLSLEVFEVIFKVWVVLVGVKNESSRKRDNIVFVEDRIVGFYRSVYGREGECEVFLGKRFL